MAVDLGKGGGGSTRSTALEDRMRGSSGGRGGGGRRGKDTVSAQSVEGYKVVPNAQATGLQRALIRRHQQEYVQGRAEGRAGEDQASKIGTGLRKTIKCVDSPLRFTGQHTTKIRKTNFERMFGRGEADQAMAKLHQFTSRRKMKRGGRRKGGRALRKFMESEGDGTNEALGTQYGIRKQANDSFKKRKKGEKYLDNTSLF